MCLRVTPLHFTFIARDAITFPEAAGNTFRGAIGAVLRRIAPPEIYHQIFEPRTTANQPSGFATQPRPFVLRAATLNQAHFEPGATFTLHILTFDPSGPTKEWLPRVFKTLATEGLTANRATLNLESVEQLPELTIPLTPGEASIAELEIRFLTPTELKHDGAIVPEPSFPALFTRARDRVSALCALYQGGSPAANYPLLTTQSHSVKMTACHIEQHLTARHSSRTGQRHCIGGFTGSASYAGDLTPFIPWLHAAQWTGIGRHTAWGNGHIQLSPAA